jgi:restriction system protein
VEGHHSAPGDPEVRGNATLLEREEGVFITTSDYSKGARQFAEGLQDKVVLIDGEMLSSPMIDYGVGVTPEAAYEIKRVDSDYFNEA